MFNQMQPDQIKVVLQNHQKVTTRVENIKTFKEHSKTKTFTYHQCILLLNKVRHMSALELNFISGIKYAINKNGSIFMHTELIQDTKDNYCHEECLLDPA
eukprot:4105960-Ditylum_brightwellii.AAC.1